MTDCFKGQTNFPQRPRRRQDTDKAAWMTWDMLQWFVTSVFDPFAKCIEAKVNAIVPGTGGVLIAGSVYNDGDIFNPPSDPGFSVTLVTAGSAGVPAEYTVVFDTPLDVIPVTQLTVNNNNGAIANDSTYQAGIKSGSETVNGFSVLTRAFDPTAPVNDGGWNFACFKPGPA